MFGFKTCSYCGWPFWVKEIATSYWHPGTKYPVHKYCKKTYEAKIRAYCKDLDADCNDCKHFKRGEWLSKTVCSGICMKTGKPTEARPNHYSGKPCYEPR